jgi:hypothetical protein
MRGLGSFLGDMRLQFCQQGAATKFSKFEIDATDINPYSCAPSVLLGVGAVDKSACRVTRQTN